VILIKSCCSPCSVSRGRQWVEHDTARRLSVTSADIASGCHVRLLIARSLQCDRR